MEARLDVQDHGPVRAVVIDRPPVNALNQPLRQGLLEAVEKFAGDPGCQALVIAGRGALFSAGSDITEFSQGRRPPSLEQVMLAIEACPKPVIAALHGRTLGGALELALACHARVSERGALLGLPESRLGLLPGAGGTQRLPRLIGAAAALAMIAEAREVRADEAVALGLVDEVFDGDPVAAGVAFARNAVASGRRFQLAATREDHLAAHRASPEAFEAQAAAVLRRSRGRASLRACVEAVRCAMTTPLHEGLQRERALFSELEAADESRALRHLFFAERGAARLPKEMEQLATEPPRRAAVVGAGLMGSGIAMCLANAGVAVTLIDTAAAPLDRGLAGIAKQYQRMAASGRLKADEAAAILARISGRLALDAVADADVVIEAAPEILALKQDIFRALGRLAKPGALLATNTSTLDVDQIAAASGRAADVVGLHFFSPAHVMRAVEVVRGAGSSAAAIARAVRLARMLGKLPAIVGVCDGFVANRMMGKRSRQVDRLLLEGATPQQIDKATTDFGFAMGPLAVADLAGLDVAQKVRQSRGQVFPVADALCAAGRHGQKTGAGYYRYEAGSREALDDPVVARLIAEVAAREGVAARAFSDDEILDRTLLPVINEGARILGEGMAAHAGDIDVILVHGYGWPAWRGGPMHYADQQGLAAICERLSALAEQIGDASLRPAPLLRQLAESGGRLADLPRTDLLPGAARQTSKEAHA